MGEHSSLLGPRVPRAVAEAHPMRFLAPSLLLATAAGLLVASIFLPYWVMVLKAPQYPKGLEIRTYLNRLEGDVAEVDGLNHYIGMRPMAEAAQLERSVSVIAVSAIALLVVGAVFLHNRRAAYLALPALAFPVLFLADLAYWLRDFGTNLDPTAPLSSSIKPFVPPVLGTGYVGQFATVARPGPGLILATVATLVIVTGLYLHRRAYKPLVEAERRGGNALSILLVGALSALASGAVSLAEPLEITVSESGGRALAEAVAAAVAGDVIVVEGGVHRGPFELDRQLVLRGRAGAVLEGGGSGTVVSVTAPGVEVSGFSIRGSGKSLDQENAGIAVGAPRARIAGNRLEDVLFGIYLRAASDTRIEGNVITGKNFDLPRRGDAIRVWQSDRVALTGNRVRDSRDVVLWYSNDLLVEDNEVARGRYGLHFMYCDDATIRGNLLVDNSVGAFLMYSRRLRLHGNTVAGNHGPSGYGVGLKDMDDAEVRGNLFLGNRVGAFLDNSPREITSGARLEGNRFVGNDAGVVLLPNVRRAEFLDNSFEENQEQVSIRGGGASVAENRWVGNYWSDYEGFDVDGDGTGDVPYRSERLFEAFSDRAPELEIFSLGLAARFLDFAARVLPAVRPQPKLTDPAPRSSGIALAGVPPLPTTGGGGWRAFSALLLVCGAFAAGIVRRSGPAPPGREREPRLGEAPALPAVHFEAVTKRFGETAALDRVSFEVAAGRATALWGGNGAGKTTALRVLLGLARYKGQVRVQGLDPRTAGRAVRSLIGYVPQSFGFLPGFTVRETLLGFARLRGATLEEVERLLAELELENRADQLVETLSGGWRQRVALAVARIGDPPILLLDEPSANLDGRTRATLLAYLQRLKAAGKTLIFASHRAGEVRFLADRVLRLDNGRLAAAGTPEEVLGDEQVRIRLRAHEDDRSRLERQLAGAGYEVAIELDWLAVSVRERDKAGLLQTVCASGAAIEDIDLDDNPESEHV